MTKPICIIGAGIGGLTTALSLQKRGLSIQIFESAPEIKPVGAGIILANNAMQVFQKLGLQSLIENAGNKISMMKITDEQLNPLQVVDLLVYEKQYGVSNVAIHRGELQKILANAVGYENIHLSKRLENIEEHTGFKLKFEDGNETFADILIGADGIKSKVREQLFAKGSIRDAKQTCWRGIANLELKTKYTKEINEAWGKGRRFGFVKIAPNKVYWYALIKKSTSDSSTDLRELFKAFHPDILEVITTTPASHITTSDIIDLSPINIWQKSNVCLVGDAAHATTPNLGQGACQAIEDAHVLGQLLDKKMPLSEVFKNYERLRIKKAHYIVRTSWTLGKLAHIENSLGVWLRNYVLKLTPTAANKQQMDKIFKLN
jgi:2-polyprenyl-6-methoxyphenol hydroxylase-like FAD-dependent oxidoreductase